MRELPKFEPKKKVLSKVFEENLVNMVSLGSFFRYNNKLFIVEKPSITKTFTDIKTESQFLEMRTQSHIISQIHYPVVSFDGVLVLLMNNIPDTHKRFLYSKRLVPEFTKNSSTYDSHPVEFYDTQDPDIMTELSPKGMEQLKSFYIAGEEFECATIIKHAIEDDEALLEYNHELDPLRVVDSAVTLAAKIGLPYVVPNDSE